ncbi:MAG TPA: hypothetical protein DEA44_09615 [Firmicutes bacterium]|nr:hypothetical protein [Bacillota bacterium]
MVKKLKNRLRKWGIILALLTLTLPLQLFLPGTVQGAESPVFTHEAASLVIAGADEQAPAIFWLKLMPGQAGRERMLAVRREAGLEPGRFGEVDYIVCRVNVLADSFVVSEQIYFDGAGEVIADWTKTDWAGAEQPGEMLAAEAQAVLPAYFTNSNADFPRGFCGIPWGASPAALPGAIHDETLQEVLRIYGADVDVSALLGDVKQVKKAWLVFDRNQGLQRGVINFDGRDYDKVLRRLTGLFGNPRWEPRRGLYWQLADDLRIEIEVMPAFGMLHGSLHVENPKFAPYERQLFRNKLK